MISRVKLLIVLFLSILLLLVVGLISYVFIFKTLPNEHIRKIIHENITKTENNEPVKNISECKNDQFKCTSGECIYVANICNEVIDCPDESDESELICQWANRATCKLIYKNHIKVRCNLKEKYPCEDKKYKEISVRARTMIKLRCSGYIPADYQQMNYTNGCTDKGTWNSSWLSCDSVILDNINGSIISYKNLTEINEKEDDDGGKIQSAKIEETRNNNGCQYDHFKCESGQCIHKLNVCNNVNDCEDSSDENEEICGGNNTKTCNLPYEQTIRYRCEFKGTQIEKGKIYPCFGDRRPWTKINAQCNIGFVPQEEEKWNFTNICQDNGEWLYHIPKCSPECGKVTTIEVKDKNDSNKRVNVTYHPWTALIYKIEGEEYKLHCLGTLVSDFSILTDVACVREENGEDIDPTKFKVVLGKVYDEFNSNDEEHPHYSNVAGIETIRTLYVGKNVLVTDLVRRQNLFQGKYFREDHINYQSSLAYIAIENPPIKTRYISPICREINKFANQTGVSPVGNVFSWTSGNMLGEIKLTAFHPNNCTKYVNLHKSANESDTEMSFKISPPKFCVYNDTCELNCPQIMRGAGLSFNFNGTYYLVGIATQSFALNKDKNGGNMINVFDLSLPFLWELRKIPYDWTILNAALRRCHVPYNIGTKYSLSRCLANENCSEIQSHFILDNLSVLYMSCEENYTLDGQCKVRVCVNGKWYPDDTACIRICEPLKPMSSMKSYCKYKNKNVSCSDVVRAGTTASSYCETPDLNANAVHFNNTCQENGKWMNSPKSLDTLCTPKCGLLHTQLEEVEDNAESIETNYPWSATIYRKWKNGTIDHLCSGTLITVYAVLSAAHCFQDFENGQTVRIHPRRVRIGLGKNYSEYDPSSNIGRSQLLEVQEVHIPAEYEGKPLHYHHDIAVVELKKKAELNDFLLPACIDINNENILDDDSSYGTVVSWRVKTKMGIKTEAVKKLNLPYTSRDECLHSFPEKYKALLVSDKFCAFYDSDEKDVTIGSDDSGAGITFLFNGRHYLYGLVSKSWNTINMFTNITNSYNLNFIKEIVKNQFENNKQQIV